LKNVGKQNRSKHTIQTILSAASQVLIEHGYEKATTNRIAERAGYSVGTLYQYFSNKEDVYAVLVGQELRKLAATTNDCPIQGNLRETLREWLSRILAGFGRDPLLIQALETLLVEQFKAQRQGAYEELVASVVKLLEAHRDEIVVEDLQVAARVIVGATAGMANASDVVLLESLDLEVHILRLQYAYLTMKD
jgi:AcrR family transcriptional regulator